MSITTILWFLLLTTFGSASSTFNRTIFVRTGSDVLISCPFTEKSWDIFGTHDWIVNCDKKQVAPQFKSSINVTENCDLMLMNFSINIKLKCYSIAHDVLYTVDVRKYQPPANIEISLKNRDGSESTNGDGKMIECAANETCVLNCTVKSGEPLETLILLKSNAVLTTGGPGFLAHSITPALSDDMSDYVCEANNSANIEPLRAQVQLKIIGLPDVQLLVKPNKKVQAGTKTTIHCINQGLASTSDSFTWKWNGFSINHTSSTLNFESISQERSGEYECSVTNIGGKNTRSVSIEVKAQESLGKSKIKPLTVFLPVSVSVVCCCLIIVADQNEIGNVNVNEIEYSSINRRNNDAFITERIAAEAAQSIERRHIRGNFNQESKKLNYVEISFDEQANSNFQIRGIKNKTPYSLIDFNATAEPLSSSDSSDDEDKDEDFMTLEDIQQWHIG